MRIIRALGGSLLGIVAGLLGLVGVLLCATIILLPLGVPVLMLAKRVVGMAMALMLPRKVRHPVDELGKTVAERAEHGKKTSKKASKKATKKGKSFLRKQRKRVA